ncbi:MAG: hypothetical protein IH604_18930 [Burkholderiales bacterium]|nr:hypothetical protein [Burkholderiales bacterium]
MSILDWLHRDGVPRVRDSNADLRVMQAIDIAILGVDARLSLVEGYADRMLPAVETALAHCSALAAAIPGPIDLLPDAWYQNPGVRALFAQPAEIDRLLDRSPEVLAFAAQAAQAGVDEIFAVISVVRTEQKVLGWANYGDVVRKDNVQRTVSFSHHRLLAPSASEAELRCEIEWRAFEHLAIDALAGIVGITETGLAEGRISALLRERLKLLQRARAGLDVLHQPPEADHAAFQNTRQQLMENDRQLASLHGHANSLEERLARVIEVFSSPADIIAFSEIEDRLTSLNIVADADEDVSAVLRLADISLRGAQLFARSAAIVRLSRRQLKPRRMDFSAAERRL